MRTDYDDALSVRRPGGAIIVNGVQVADTLQCVHCNAHWVPRIGSGQIRGYCRACAGPVCGPSCAACVPYERRLEMAEKAIGARD